MKLTYVQLEAHLSKTLAPIYIVSGDELLLKHEAIQLLRKTAKKAGFSERSRISPEAGFDWEQLYTELYSASLLAEKRILELDFRDSTPNKTASAILQEYATKPVADVLLLIDISKIDDKISKSAWYKSLEKAGIVVTIWPIPREQLPQWIRERAKKYKIQFQPEAAILLADYIEGNLVAAAQTLEKIYLLQPTQTVDVDLLKTVLTDESRFTVFDLLENMIAGDKKRALHILENLRLDGTEPTFILWGITRELRLLAELLQQKQQGQTYDYLFQKYRIFARRQAAVRQFLTKFSVTDCWGYLTHAEQIDKMIKGAVASDVWKALQLFCLRML